MSTVGTAYVVVRAISPALRRDIGAAVSDSVKKASPAIEDAGRKAGDAAAKGMSDSVEKSAPDIGTKLGDGVTRGFGARFRTSMSRTIQRVTRSIDTSRSTDSLASRMSRDLAQSLDRFRIPGKFWLGFLAIPALGGALQILAAYVAAATSLVGAMGPAIAAAGGVAAAGIGTLIGVFAAMTIAFKTKTDELKAFKENIAGISAQFRPVAVAIQRSLFPGLEKGFSILTRAIPTLRTGLSGLGATVGDVAVNLARVVTSSTNLRNLAIVFREGQPQLTAYGNALGSLATIFTTIAAVSAPIATRFAQFVEAFASGAEAATLAGAESGKLAAFMERAADVAAQLGQITGDTFRGLFNVLSASSGAGQTLLDRISALAARFAEWSGSIQGQNALRQFFENALPVVREVNGLIGDLLRIIVAPLASGDTGGVITFIRSLRTDVIPALQQVGDAAGQLGPHLIELTTAFAGLISSLANSGALGAFVGTLSVLLDGVSAVLQLPVVGQLAGWGLAFLGAAKAVGIVLAPIGGLATVSKILSPVLNVVTGALGKLGTLLLGKFVNGLIFLGKTVLPLVITGVRALGIALFTNPIGIVIGLIALLVTGLVIAYNKSETFRGIVNKVGAAIRDGFIATLEWLKDLWATVWPALVSGFNAVRGVVGTVVSLVVGYFKLWWSAVQTLWNGLKTVFSFIASIFPTILNIVTQPIQGIIQILTGAWQIISGIFTGNLDKITSGIANIIGGIVRFFAGMPARIVPYLIQFGQFLWEKISGAAVAVYDYMVQWVANLVIYLGTLPGKAVAAVTGLIAGLRAWAVNTWEVVKAATVIGIDRAISFMKALPGRALAAVNGLVANLRGLAQRALESFNERVRSGITTAITTLKNLPSRIKSAIGNLGTLLLQAGRDLINGLKKGITDALGGLLRTARDMAGKITSAVKGALDMNSPSRVFADIGFGLGEGLIVGIGKVSRAVNRAAEGLAETATPKTPTVTITTGTGPGPGVTGRGPGGPPAAGASAGRDGTLVIQELSMTFSIDDLAKIGTVSDFIELLKTARVTNLQTDRSGTVNS